VSRSEIDLELAHGIALAPSHDEAASVALNVERAVERRMAVPEADKVEQAPDDRAT
jgi:hypothetical protein